ncbi:glycosyltransferase family 2 protein [Vibrio fluvialis]|uniref:glycosyltransferase family 2 protein n=1 Tax=Vibrio fluvialis TaxID=676 RepID=UPI00192C5A87|nr:glycosyltransferase family 2 protein [Vibrio fluvialis]MBL4307084.1 glycosyltransferase family 2 protein [Vibrio fluvialis]MBY7847282.1 glycosyltransferase family 2 protein [Vibrio fluvialis]MBY8082960.1 glycosyltransferase family 2 protein [Vibrio fluvialis]
MKSKNKISLIAPFYNEEKGVFHFIERVNSVMEKVSDRFDLEVICINDGSRDGTLKELIQVKKDNSHMKIVDFSRNFGKEAAITAGLDFATGDIVVPIDSDLQHPPEVILDMVKSWEEGYEVVLARRVDRDTDRAIQRMTARAFYEVSRYISHIDIPADVGDFRLMDRKVVEAIKQLNENCRFMKGIFAWVGFRTTTIDYKVENRAFGKTSFNTWKLWNFALEGITSFSTFPLRVWTYLGMTISSLSFLFAIYLIIKTLIFGVETPGYTSTMVTILFCSGVQLIGVGVLGEYIGRIFSEVKRRPSYIVREMIE